MKTSYQLMNVVKRLSVSLVVALAITGSSFYSECIAGLNTLDPVQASEIASSAHVLTRPETMRCLFETLVASGKTTEAENRALSNALDAYSAAASDKRGEALVQFTEEYPNSAWNGSVFLNLGLYYHSVGYWSKCLDAFEKAWNISKGDASPQGRMVADLSLGHLAEFNARLGRLERLNPLFEEIQGRNVSGPGAGRIAGARQGLWLMVNQPGEAFKCGPYALARILAAKGEEGNSDKNEILKEVRSSVNGLPLSSVKELSDLLGMKFQMARRNPGAKVIIPSVVHWKVGHFAALVQEDGGQYLMEDLTFSSDTWVTRAVVDLEGSGYFLVPQGVLPDGWTNVNEDEAAKIWGKGTAYADSNPPPPDYIKKIFDKSCYGMATYFVDANRVGLMLQDTPLMYAPPHGPVVQFTASYSKRDIAPMANPNYANLGPQWNLNWCSFLTVDPTRATSSAPSNTKSYGPGGGVLSYAGNSGSNSYKRQFETSSILTDTSPTGLSHSEYTQQFPDGSVRIYGLSDGSLAFPRKVYITKSIDPQGNALTFQYDSSFRLVGVTDSLGQATILSYELGWDLYKVTKVTDPFGRRVFLEYNSNGQLWKITDTAGLVSEVIYGTNGSVDELITPYGTTYFSAGDNGSKRWVEITDPQGGKERIEFISNGAPILGSEPSSTVPNSTKISPANSYFASRSTFIWDKKAMREAPYIYKYARQIHWFHIPNSYIASDVPEASKQPFENRVWYKYPGQPNSYTVGTSNRPIVAATVLENGATQIKEWAYNQYGNLTKEVDPLGRSVSYSYDSNGVDVTRVSQTTGTSNETLIETSYNAKHLPILITNADGGSFEYTYNSFGQVLSITNPKGEITQFAYDRDQDSDGINDGYLVSVTDQTTGAETEFGYDEFGRLSEITNPEGDTASFEYEALGTPSDPTRTLNRIAKVTYLDGTSEEFTYNRLDLEYSKDRMDRWTRRYHDSLRRLVAIQDPMNRFTNFKWCSCGSLSALIDANGNRTSWSYDIQGRLTDKWYPDGSRIKYAYENGSGRLKTVTDALGQVSNYTYYNDDSLKQGSFLNALNPTPSTVYTYDQNYPRVSGVANVSSSGTSAIAFRYHPMGSIGAGHLAGIDTDSYSVNYEDATGNPGYDELGRLISWSIDGASNSVTTLYDSLGRVTANENPLGVFQYGYVGHTNRLSFVEGPNNLRTNFSYYDAMGGRRLKQIKHLEPLGNMMTQFDYAFNGGGEIVSWKQFQNGLSGPHEYTLVYDPVSQLTGAALVGSGSNTVNRNYQYRYDKSGNRLTSQIDSESISSNYNILNQLTGIDSGGWTYFKGIVSKPSQVTVGGNLAKAEENGTFEGKALLLTGTNTVAISATDANSNTTTNLYRVVVPESDSRLWKYDLNGNLTDDGTHTFGWDAGNRLLWIAYKGTTKRTEFEYDALGRRVKIVEKDDDEVASEKRYVWNGLEICEERDSNNNVTRRFYSQGEQIGGVGYYYHQDHLGSVRGLVNANGEVKAAYDYDLWGNRSENPVSGAGSIETPTGYTGHYYHAGSKLHLTLYRAYDSNSGKWISRDPIGESGGMNLYGYVANSPINSVDPLGLWYVTNPVTWFDGGGYEGISGRWDAYQAVTADAFEQGAYAGLDGLIPGADPFGDRGFYDRCNKGSQWSVYFGTVSQEALWTAGGLKLAKFRGFEYGRWKDAGKWREGTHFHFDWGKGLEKHHLPQQTGNFLRNLRGVIKRW